MLSLRTAMLAIWVGPAAALVSLQSAIIISSRVNDARTAQQFESSSSSCSRRSCSAVLLPFGLSATMLALLGLGLIGVWVLLVLLSVAIFDRDSILTRWR